MTGRDSFLRSECQGRKTLDVFIIIFLIVDVNIEVCHVYPYFLPLIILPHL